MPKSDAKEASKNFGGGGGSGVNITPVSFLIISPNGKVDLLNVNDPLRAPSDAVSQIIGAIERSPELIEKIKEIFNKKKDKAE